MNIHVNISNRDAIPGSNNNVVIFQHNGVHLSGTTGTNRDIYLYQPLGLLRSRKNNKTRLVSYDSENDKRDELLKKVGVLSGHDHDRSFRVVSSMRLEFTKPSPQYKFSDSMIYNHNFELMNVSFCLFTFKTHGIVLTVFSKWQEGQSDHISS